MLKPAFRKPLIKARCWSNQKNWTDSPRKRKGGGKTNESFNDSCVNVKHVFGCNGTGSWTINFPLFRSFPLVKSTKQGNRNGATTGNIIKLLAVFTANYEMHGSILVHAECSRANIVRVVFTFHGTRQIRLFFLFSIERGVELGRSDTVKGW